MRPQVCIFFSLYFLSSPFRLTTLWNAYIGIVPTLEAHTLTGWDTSFRPKKLQDPEIQEATGETDPVAIMAKLRELKNNFK